MVLLKTSETADVKIIPMSIEGSFQEGIEGSDTETQAHKTPNKLTGSLIIVALMGTIGNSVPAGYNMGVINMPQAILKDFCKTSLNDRGLDLNREQIELLWAFVVSLFLAGAMIGSLSAGYFANNYGRKRTLLFNSAAGILSAVLFAFCRITSSVEMLIAGRVLVGYFSGLSSSVVPLYLMETTPISMRGAFGVMQQLGLTVGILISQILGQHEILGTDDMWPTLLSLYGFAVGFGLLLLVFCPKSPSYLYNHQHNEAAAFKALEKLRGRPVSDLHEDIKELKKEQKLSALTPNSSMWSVLKAPHLRMPLLLVCSMHAGQQLSGISAVFYYSITTFEKAGMTNQQSQWGSIGASLMNALMACLAVPLVNRNRRRTLIMISTIGVSITLVGLCVSIAFQNSAPFVSYLVIAAFLSFVCIYGVGLGPLAYMIGSELFQQAPRAAAMGLGCASNWMANFVIAITFPYMQEHLSSYIFLIYAGIIIALSIFLYLYLPETKGLDPVEVALSFRPEHKMLKNQIDDKHEILTAI